MTQSCIKEHITTEKKNEHITIPIQIFPNSNLFLNIKEQGDYPSFCCMEIQITPKESNHFPSTQTMSSTGMLASDCLYRHSYATHSYAFLRTRHSYATHFFFFLCFLITAFSRNLCLVIIF